ncbi:disease resistance protein RUN1 [Trifolium repens]|nr:disease resistance protein RUN1 [Trifolium repens]
MECHKNGQVVIPVFFQIDPSHVRKQTKSYATDLAKHKQQGINDHKIQNWKNALSQAAKLSGFHSTSYRTEFDLIEDITKVVLTKLNHNNTNEFTSNFILDDIYWSIQSLIKKKDSAEVQIVGLWGMGGIGKTTLAAAMFHKLSFQYEGSCFLENVTEVSSRHGINYTCNKLLSKLLKEDVDIDTPKVIPSMINRRLKRMKSFIVLDDVHTSELLQNLIGVGHGWLGAGSTVIVTTRDKHVLISGGIEKIHQVKKMNFRNSLQLFRLNAFDGVLPKEGFMELSERAIDYANGNPLALKVLGSLLRCKSEIEWNCALAKLKKIPNPEIDSIFRWSYNELDDTDKNIFLDIACFFKGHERQRVTKILNECDFFADIGIRHLLDKALISVDFENCIQMHDLIQEMGKQIVREESLKNPGQRSRLCDSKEVCDVLKNNRGTEMVEAIFLDAYEYTNMNLSPKTFEKMVNLRLLAIRDPTRCVNLPHGLDLLPENLRYFLWHGYPLKSLPPTFCPKMLVELSMKHSHAEKLWNGVVNLPNLERLDLGFCSKLRECPNVSVTFASTDRLALNLSNWGGIEFPSSLLNIKNLGTFYSPLIECLANLPENFANHLWLDSSPNCEHDPSVTLHKLVSSPAFLSVKKLTLYYIDFLVEIPDNISLLSSLESLTLIAIDIISLPETIKHLPQLMTLGVYECERLQSIPMLSQFIPFFIVWNCVSLEEVLISMDAPDVNLNGFSFILNCENLEQHSNHTVLENAIFGIERLARLNLEDEDHIKYLLPGMPDLEYWFHYTSTRVSFTLELPPNLLGFSYYLVLSPGRLGYLVDFGCECYFDNCLGERINITSFATASLYEIQTDYNYSVFMESDHVVLWYDPASCKKILEEIEAINDVNRTCYNPKLTFRFFIDKTLSDETLHDEVVIKECGFRWIYQEEAASESQEEEEEEEEEEGN